MHSHAGAWERGDKGLEHLREGFKALGVELQSLENVLTVELEALKLPDLGARQYISLLSTLAHYYSHGAEVSMSRKLRELYRILYTRAHEMRHDISALKNTEAALSVYSDSSRINKSTNFVPDKY